MWIFLLLIRKFGDNALLGFFAAPTIVLTGIFCRGVGRPRGISIAIPGVLPQKGNTTHPYANIPPKKGTEQNTCLGQRFAEGGTGDCSISNLVYDQKDVFSSAHLLSCPAEYVYELVISACTRFGQEEE